MEIGSTTPHRMVADASDFTKMIRLTSQVGPYVASGTNAAPRLGWRSPALSKDAVYTIPLFGAFRSAFPR